MQVTAIHPDVFSIFTNVLLIFTKIRCTGKQARKKRVCFPVRAQGDGECGSEESCLAAISYKAAAWSASLL